MNILSAIEVLKSIGSVLLAIIILLAMITIHEFGHYIAGKALKFKITEFAIGFGPKLFSRRSKKTGELFSIRAVPLGGFCAFEGEDGEEVDEEGNPKESSPNAFTKKSPWSRIIVLVAGATMNYLLALALIITSYASFGQMAYRVNSISDQADSAYCLQTGDAIVSIEGKDIYVVSDMQYALDGKVEGDIVEIGVENDGQFITRQVKLISGEGSTTQSSKMWRMLGMGIVEREGVEYWDVSVSSYRTGFFATVSRSFVYSYKIAGTIFHALGDLITGGLSLDSFGGPVTTIKMTSEIASQGLQSFLEIASYIGVNLAIFNLLPIPALDGSKVVFCLIEGIFKKPVPRNIEAIIHLVGFALLIGFAVFVDVLHFF